MARAKVGVIGGSGLYQMEGLTNVEEVRIDTPFGAPSDAITIGNLGDTSVAFLPRHGRGHRISPSELPFRANIYALKLLGIESIVSVSAVGSLREDYAPLDIVVPDQLFDRTRGRVGTFFGDGLVAHVGMAEPFCPALSQHLYETALSVTPRVHKGGAYVCIEGPQFSTKAESRVYRQWGMDIIGMTAIPEAKLAREAEICYGALAMVTDYDVWHETTEAVTAEMVVMNLLKNVATSQQVLLKAIPSMPPMHTCHCQRALSDALVTEKHLVPVETRQRLAAIIDQYM
ncbi:MAG: S-methyl-5'-thioadenosine phosphorylase [Bacteroidetes bacterium]|nr:S-methyl-5'-thioadenosine phosphorylase [Bacteroidota bacterium]MCL5026270.1 S-methyl-5'-thioadenosine phosphorylase [Chloroflexota bacterium]